MSTKSGTTSWCGHYSGFEKWRLTWLTPTVISSNTDSVVLCDQATTTDIAKNRLLKIPISGTDQYFLVENRREISGFETRFAVNTNPNPNAKLKPGVFVYHIVFEQDGMARTQVKMLCADGQFTWGTTYFANSGNNDDDIIDKLIPDAINGYDEREYIFIPSHPGHLWKVDWFPSNGNSYGGGNYRYCTNLTNLSTATRDYDGDSLDVFDVGDVITKWSNPGSHLWTGTTFDSTSIGIEIKSLNPTTQAYTLAIRLTNPEQLAPSKPQNLQSTFHSSSSAILAWNANREPDLSGYNVYRGVYYAGSGEPIYTKVNPSLVTGSSTYTDTASQSMVGLPQNTVTTQHVKK